LLLTPISLWFLAVYALRIAVFGNPLVQHVTAASPAQIAAADASTGMEEMEESDPETARFISGFFRRAMLGLAMLIVEFALLARLYWLDVLPWLAMILFVRGLIVAAIGSVAAGCMSRDQGTFSAILAMPRWMHRLDRINSLVSGVGALVFLFVIIRS
jgi:hypothetical protein